MNIAAIDAESAGYTDIVGCGSENIVALADPDDGRGSRGFKLHEKAPRYKDARKILDKELNNIDAVTVSSFDHLHGMAAMWAMLRGKHVYCQKPLTRTVWEASELTKAAAKNHVV